MAAYRGKIRTGNRKGGGGEINSRESVRVIIITSRRSKMMTKKENK